jgi:hypothetical protein
MRDQLEQVIAVDRGMAEALVVQEPVRIKAAAADLHDRAGQALGSERVHADLPGHCCRVVKRVIEAARPDGESGVGGAWIGRAERVQLLDGPVGVDDGQGTRQQPESLESAGLAEHQLDQFAEQPDPGLLAGRAVPALEDADQPPGIPGARRRGTPVGVRQEQV